MYIHIIYMYINVTRYSVSFFELKIVKKRWNTVKHNVQLAWKGDAQRAVGLVATWRLSHMFMAIWSKAGQNMFMIFMWCSCDVHVMFMWCSCDVHVGMVGDVFRWIWLRPIQCLLLFESYIASPCGSQLSWVKRGFCFTLICLTQFLWCLRIFDRFR